MAALLSPSLSLPPLNNKVNPVSVSTIAAYTLPTKNFQPIVRNGRINRYHWLTKAKMSAEADVLAQDSVNVESIDANDYGIVSMHHVGILCENLERSLDFYQNVLGLKINEARPDDKLPYRGAWLWVGSEMIHLMELPNPDPLTGRPQHGGRDRHTCVAIQDVSRLKAILDKAGIPYTLSRSGRPAIFFRDRHTCVAIQDVSRLKAILDKAGIPYTLSRSGRPAIFFRDPDANALEFAEFDI